MKLLRFGLKGQEKPGILDGNGQIRSLENIITDLNGDALSPDSLIKLAHIDPYTLPLIHSDTRIGPCVAQPGKFLCVGLNYLDHAKETGCLLPREPVLFSKATSAINGPYDDVIIPRGSQKTDWEVELGIVIGTAAKYVSKENA